jgi:hypothetical protein
MFGEAIVQYQLIFDINSLNMHHTSPGFLWIADFMLTLRWVSELMIVFNANSAIIQLYHCQCKLIFNEMMMRSDLF